MRLQTTGGGLFDWDLVSVVEIVCGTWGGDAWFTVGRGINAYKGFDYVIRLEKGP